MIRRILVPVDGTADDAAVLPAVRQLLAGTGAGVHLLATRSLPTPDTNRSVWSFNPESAISATLLGSGDAHHDPPVSFDQLVRREHAMWDRYLTRFGNQLTYDGVVVRREIRFGETVPEILAAVQRHAIHLIVLAPQMQGWWDRLRRPGLAEQLMRCATVPVLVAPSEQAATTRAALRYDQVAV